MRVCLNPNVAKSSLAVRPSFLRKWKMKRRNCPLRHSARIFDMHPASRQKGRKAASRNRPVVLGQEVFSSVGEWTPLSYGNVLGSRQRRSVIIPPTSTILTASAIHTAPPFRNMIEIRNLSPFYPRASSSIITQSQINASVSHNKSPLIPFTSIKLSDVS